MPSAKPPKHDRNRPKTPQRLADDVDIPLAQSGDIEARNRIITRHMGVIVTITGSCLQGEKYRTEQYLGVAVESFIRGIAKYRAGSPAGITTYCDPGIRRDVWRAIQRDRLMRGQYVRRGKSRTTWRQDLFFDPRSRECPPETDEYGYDIRERLRLAIRMLDSEERTVIALRLQDKTMRDIGDSMNISRESARLIEVRALARLAHALGRSQVPISIWEATTFQHGPEDEEDGA